MSRWSWLALVGLGAFHGVNPAMGWLFAVALGLHRRSRAVVLGSLIPIAVGHALAIGLVALGVGLLGAAINQRALRVASGVVLIGSHAGHMAGHHMVSGSLAGSLAAIAVHTLAMLAVTGTIAVVVYDWVGLAFLRRGWINLDLLWSMALIATGLLLVASAGR